MLARLLLVACLCGLSCACAGPAASPLPRATLLMDKGRDEEASQLLRDYLKKNPEAVAERRLLIRVEASRGDLNLMGLFVRGEWKY